MSWSSVRPRSPAKLNATPLAWKFSSGIRNQISTLIFSGVRGADPVGAALAGQQPIEGAPAQAQREISVRTNRGESSAANHVAQPGSRQLRNVQLRTARGGGEVVDAQNRLTFVDAQVRQNCVLISFYRHVVADPEGRVLAADFEHAAYPVQQRSRLRELGLDVHARVVIGQRLHYG